MCVGLGHKLDPSIQTARSVGVIRELTNRRLLHNDAVGLRDISTAQAHPGNCRCRDKVDDVGESDLPASWKQQDVRLFFNVFSRYLSCFCQTFQVSPLRHVLTYLFDFVSNSRYDILQAKFGRTEKLCIFLNGRVNS